MNIRVWGSINSLSLVKWVHSASFVVSLILQRKIPVSQYPSICTRPHSNPMRKLLNPLRRVSKRFHPESTYSLLLPLEKMEIHHGKWIHHHILQPRVNWWQNNIRTYWGYIKCYWCFRMWICQINISEKLPSV